MRCPRQPLTESLSRHPPPHISEECAIWCVLPRRACDHVAPPMIIKNELIASLLRPSACVWVWMQISKIAPAPRRLLNISGDDAAHVSERVCEREWSWRMLSPPPAAGTPAKCHHSSLSPQIIFHFDRGCSVNALDFNQHLLQQYASADLLCICRQLTVPN